MGKLNVTVLRYLTKEDFRVLTAVSEIHHCDVFDYCVGICGLSYTCFESFFFFILVWHRSKWAWRTTNWCQQVWLHRLQILKRAEFTNCCVNYVNTNYWRTNVAVNVSSTIIKSFKILSFNPTKCMSFFFWNRWWISINQHWLRLFSIEIAYFTWFSRFVR